MHLRKLKIMTAGASLFNIVAFLGFKIISAFGRSFFFLQFPRALPIGDLFILTVNYCQILYSVSHCGPRFVHHVVNMSLVRGSFNLKSQLFLVIPHYML